MSLHAETPKLPKLPFFIADVALLGLAALIAVQARDPYSGSALIAIVACVALGAVALVVPFIADYGRKTDALLSERQDQIAALAQTTAASAEQVSIAATSLNSIADSSARSAKTIESLPHRLQEKIAEFKSQLNEVTVSENEALEQELQSLRAAESDRLVAAIDQLAKTASDLSRLESLARTQAGAAADALATLPKLAEQAAARATDSIAQAAAAARAELDRTFSHHQTTLAAKITALGTANAGLDERITRLQRLIESAASIAPKQAESVARPPAKVEAVEKKAADTTEKTEPPQKKQPSDEEDEGDNDEDYNDRGEPMSVNIQEKITPKTPASAPPPPSLPPPLAVPVRSDASRDYTQMSSDDDAPEPALSADGATRLIVTAYIGIGNKLYVRGSGPGLSWDKGVPLQFVSIGKWRWETMDAAAAISARLYKNDQIECTTIGSFTIEPGHQCELTATF